MFQAIVTPGERSDLGQHYTSVPNILKTIEPLFLDDLKEQLDAGFDSVKKLEALLERISAIKVFDPPVGPATSSSLPTRNCAVWSTRSLERLAEIDIKHQVLYAESKINIEQLLRTRDRRLCRRSGDPLPLDRQAPDERLSSRRSSISPSH
jgi:hypothetical protein